MKKKINIRIILIAIISILLASICLAIKIYFGWFVYCSILIAYFLGYYFPKFASWYVNLPYKEGEK